LFKTIRLRRPSGSQEKTDQGRLFLEIKERRFYDKPSVQKKKKQAKAAKRRRKRMRRFV